MEEFPYDTVHLGSDCQRGNCWILATAPAATPASSSSTIIVAQQPTDDTFKDRIEYRLETSSLVRKYDVDVKVKDGVATLEGDVATAAQKAEAERLAKVDGVKRVDSTIKVDANADKSSPTA